LIFFAFFQKNDAGLGVRLNILFEFFAVIFNGLTIGARNSKTGEWLTKIVTENCNIVTESSDKIILENQNDASEKTPIQAVLPKILSAGGGI
jgi:hypothetical protein